MDEDITERAAAQRPGLIEPLTDLEEAGEYAESRVRELTVLQRRMTKEMRESGYEDVCRERLRIYRTLAWAARMARHTRAESG